ncbi:ester cyclase [Lacimicrobium sp. SS2-24]|uniref:nuclear transport factor 2 family protein n=1 Tax=Lacimicrobium sp. SS2-24 TaxID=2005569 RepID=UPI000B4B1B02|nr:ester cyclase [Lacimicrobium sp. SS2-24]
MRIVVLASWLIMTIVFCPGLKADEVVSDDTSESEAMVVDFYRRIFILQQDVREIAERYLHPDYIQHNPFVPTGREAFITAVSSWRAQMPETQRTRIKRVVSSADHVVLHVHQYDISNDKPGRAGVDIFRVSDGKIVEHWDVWQDIPGTMPHENGMF